MTETRARFKDIGGSVVKTNATGSAAIAASFTAIQATKLVSVTCHFSAAPTTSENLTITLNANAGAAYDVLLFKIDPASQSATDLVIGTDDWGLIELVAGDAIDVAYTNTDGLTYGVEITAEEIL